MKESNIVLKIIFYFLISWFFLKVIKIFFFNSSFKNKENSIENNSRKRKLDIVDIDFEEVE